MRTDSDIIDAYKFDTKKKKRKISTCIANQEGDLPNLEQP